MVLEQTVYLMLKDIQNNGIEKEKKLKANFQY